MKSLGALRLALLLCATTMWMSESASAQMIPNSTLSLAIQQSQQMMSNSLANFNTSSMISANRRAATRRGAVVRGGVGSFRAETGNIVPQQLATSSTTNQQQQRELATFFTQQLRLYENERRRAGQPTQDLATAIAYFVGINFNAVHGDVVATDADVANLTNQLNAIFAGDAKLKAMTNREKQTVYESMAILARTIVTGYEAAEAAGNQAVMNQFRQMARDNLKNLLGTTPERMRFTANGLEIN